ncbi:MAG: hypothetical protein ABR497_07105, partial [Kiritimatiellia bacterium]
LTEMARLPPGSRHIVHDPFADRRRGRIILIIVLSALLLGYLWWSGWLDRCLPETARRTAPAGAMAAPEPTQASDGND